MISRRQLLQAGAAATLLQVIAPAQSQLFVFDGRFVEARRAARAQGCSIDCSADAARAWFRDIAPVLQPDRAILGVTSAADLLILADLARSTGRKLGARQALPGGLIAWRLA